MRNEPPSSDSADIDTDKIRRDLCKKIAEGLHDSTFGFQLRLVGKDQIFSDAWLYRFRDHEWKKDRESVCESSAIAELFRQLEMIASREVADAWNCRRINHSDRVDFELKFHPESVNGHLNGDLESYLMGCLFYGHHDTGKDSRRRIRFQGH
jgi:hypothetical protein